MNIIHLCVIHSARQKVVLCLFTNCTIRSQIHIYFVHDTIPHEQEERKNTRPSKLRLYNLCLFFIIFETLFFWFIFFCCFCFSFFHCNLLKHFSFPHFLMRLFPSFFLSFPECGHSFVVWWFAINPDGYSICPTVSTEIAAPLESDVSSGGGVGGINGTTAATAHSNDITTAHQESCLWPNALQVSPFVFSVVVRFCCDADDDRTQPHQCVCVLCSSFYVVYLGLGSLKHKVCEVSKHLVPAVCCSCIDLQNQHSRAMSPGQQRKIFGFVFVKTKQIIVKVYFGHTLS